MITAAAVILAVGVAYFYFRWLYIKHYACKAIDGVWDAARQDRAMAKRAAR